MKPFFKYAIIVVAACSGAGCSRSITYKYYPNASFVDDYPNAVAECGKYGQIPKLAGYGWGDLGSRTKTYFCINRRP
jgi:hypothetical protein